MTEPPATVVTDTARYALPPGTPITMSPADATSVLCLAEVLAWSTSAAGLVVTARAITDPTSAEQLDNRNVYLSGRTPDDALVVLEAVARHHPEGDGVLELISVAALAREHRRAAVRAAVALPTVIRKGQSTNGAANGAATSVAGTTIDLSGDGCRLQLENDIGLSVGTEVAARIDLGRDGPIRLTGVVVRAAASEREIIVSFHPMPIQAAAAIDATVYAALRQ